MQRTLRTGVPCFISAVYVTSEQYDRQLDSQPGKRRCLLMASFARHMYDPNETEPLMEYHPQQRSPGNL